MTHVFEVVDVQAFRDELGPVKTAALVAVNVGRQRLPEGCPTRISLRYRGPNSPTVGEHYRVTLERAPEGC